MPAGSGFGFGPFQLDPRSKRLLRENAEVRLTARQFDLLHALVQHPGELLAKDRLIQAAWPDVAVTDNSLAQAISALRATLDPDHPDGYIHTQPRRGYRFVAPVARIGTRQSDSVFDDLLAPHRGLLEGRAALETLQSDEIARARTTFEQLVAGDSSEAAFHVGLANACVLQFEATRAYTVPEVEALRAAEAHAREACRLNADHGEAWATLGFVLERTGHRVDALAALRRATMLEPDNWRHQLRLAYGSWGEERLRAARRVLALVPRFPLAQLLAATVYVARDSLAEAERELDAGLAEMCGPTSPYHRFSAVALHWLKGLLCLTRGDEDEALMALERELSLESRNHLYARECCANTWYAIGACHLRRGDDGAARAAFDEAIARVPKHAMAHAGRALLDPQRSCELVGDLASVDEAVARAVLVAERDPEAAPQTIVAALAQAAPGNAGWLIPVEPLLNVGRNSRAWEQVLGMVRQRAV